MANDHSCSGKASHNSTASGNLSSLPCQRELRKKRHGERAEKLVLQLPEANTVPRSHDEVIVDSIDTNQKAGGTNQKAGTTNPTAVHGIGLDEFFHVLRGPWLKSLGPVVGDASDFVEHGESFTPCSVVNRPPRLVTSSCCWFRAIISHVVVTNY